MDVRVVDTNSLYARTPDQVYTYLLAHGWAVTHEDRSAWAWEHNETPNDVEIWLPKRREIRGYTARMAEILKHLSEHENRSELQILFDITHSENDVQRIRAFPDGTSGTLSINDGESAVSGMRKWILSAATLAATPERYIVQPKRKPAAVLSFMPQVRIAVPEEGSFIWTLMVPIAQDAEGDMLPFPSSTTQKELNSFNRRVSMELYNSTRLAHNASDEVLRDRMTGLEPFTRRVSAGLSVNVCEALNLAGGENRHPFEVRFNWASNRPAPPSEPIRFDSDHLRILAEASEELRNIAPEVDVTIHGYVVRLTKESELSPRIITIAGVPIDGPIDRVGHFWAELQADEYDQALYAHQNDLRVTIRGDIVRRGNRRWLSGHSLFAVAAGPS